MAKARTRINIRRKAFFFTTIAILTVSIGTAVLSYKISAKIIDNYYKTLTMDCAENFASMVDVEFLWELRKVEESEEYQAVRDHAEETDNPEEVEAYLKEQGLWEGVTNLRAQIDGYIESMDAIEYTYILRRNEEGGTTDMYIMDDSTNPTYVAGSFIETEPEFIGIGADQRIEPTISNGSWGCLCSAYVPVFLEDGTLVGQIGCDIGMDEVVHEQRVCLVHILLGTVVLTLLMVAIYGTLIDRTWIRKLSALTTELKKFNPAPTQDYEAAGVIQCREKSSDEIDDLYQSVHDMQVRIVDNINDMDSMNVELERAARMKSDFLANMSHEIRTPMNAVLGMTEIALREDITEPARDALTQIQRSGRNLLNIINDILDYSKIESGKIEIIPEKYEPLSELNDVANILSTRIGTKDLELYMVVDTKLPRLLYGDAMRIRQVLINLANNAIKFTQKGSVNIRLSCEQAGDDNVRLTYHIIDTGIGIKKEDIEKLFTSFTQIDSRRNRSVEGTGLGLAISQRLVKAMGGELGVDSTYGKGSDFWFTIEQQILDPNTDLYVENASKKKAIGLRENDVRSKIFKDEMQKLDIEFTEIDSIEDYIASEKQDYIFLEYRQYTDDMRRFFEEHPNTKGVVLIEYNSDFISGTPNVHALRRPVSTLAVIRALNDNNDVIRSAETEDDFIIDFTAPDARILVVDDNAINITVVEGLLAPMQINIDSALSGQEAIEKVTATDYDIVFMDHMMPGLDGVDATKIIRQLLPDKQNLVIIALTANVVEDAREQFTEAGMNDFAGKPIELREIVSKLKKWLPQDKIHKGTATSERTTVDADTETYPILGYEGLDSASAIDTMGSVPLYNKIVAEYCHMGEGKYEDIKSAFDLEDIDNFTIRVHALKSSSRQIGAAALGDMCEELEKAGKARDMDTIREKTGPMLETFSKLLDALAVYYPKSEEGDKSLINDEVLKEQLNVLRTACDDLDMDAMEEVAGELRKYSYSDGVQDKIDELLNAINHIDAEECERLIGELL